MSRQWPGLSGVDHLVAPLLAFLVAGVSLEADPLPDEPQESGSLLLPGRLPFGASALPTGEILAPCEDQTLFVLDQQARVLARWMAAGRFSGAVTAGARNSRQLLAAPQVGGRVDILIWDPNTQVLVSVFSVAHSAEATATAWGVRSVHLGWKDGRLEVWDAHGTLVWGTDTGFEIQRLLVDESLGVYALGPGQAELFDPHGKPIGRWKFDGSPRGVLQTMAGDLYVWTETGLWLKGADAHGFSLVDRSTKIMGVVVDRQNRLLVIEPERFRRTKTDGSQISTTLLPRPALTTASLDDRGRVFFGTAAGLEAWTYDGRWLGTLTGSPLASAPLLTDRGLGVWSDADWKVHVWKGFRWPPFGWPQEGGSPGRPFTARRPESVASRIESWIDDPDFGYYYQLAASGEESKQREVLDRLEARTARGDLLDSLPFANVILLKIARAGITDLQVENLRVTNNWPGLRLRAFALLARTAGPEDREELLSLLHKEFDPAVAAKGALALAQSGWDGDGKLMRLLSELRGRMSDQGVVADAVIDAARSLWLANGRSADPILIPLVSAVFQGPYPKSVKLKAQKFFQDLMEAP